MSDKYPLSYTYRGQAYCRADAVLAPVFDNVYVFDIADGCRIKMRRTNIGAHSNARYLSEIMDRDEMREMIEYAKQYQRYPLMVETHIGWGIFLPFLVPSSSLGMICIPKMGGIPFLRVAKHKKWKIKLTSKTAARQLRSTGIHQGDLEQSEMLWSILSECFFDIPRMFEIHGKIIPTLEERIYALSYYSAHPVRIFCKEDMISLEPFDFGLFVSYILVFLLSARAEKGVGETDVCFEACNSGFAVKLFMSAPKGARMIDRAAKLMSSVADRNNMLFEFMRTDTTATCRLIPIRKDWSYLGIKSPDDEYKNG